MNANLRRHPASFRSHFLLGVYFIKLGPESLNRAIAEFQAAVGSNPEYIPAYFNLAGIYMHLGRYEDARQAYARILRVKNDPGAAQQLRLLRGKQ